MCGFYEYDYDYSPPVNYRFARLMMPVYAAVGGGYYGMQGLWGFCRGFCGMGRIGDGTSNPMRGIWGSGIFIFAQCVVLGFWGAAGQFRVAAYAVCGGLGGEHAELAFLEGGAGPNGRCGGLRPNTGEALLLGVVAWA
jgi:hypothetical protein